MKQTALIFVIIFFPIIALSAPFIISDPQPEATKFRIRLCDPSGANCSAWVEGNPVNGGMMFDIAGISKGSYKGEAQAYGPSDSVTDIQIGQSSEVSDWSPSAFFVLIRGTITPPKIFSIKP